jgi:hypothetical protein
VVETYEGKGRLGMELAWKRLRAIAS